MRQLLTILILATLLSCGNETGANSTTSTTTTPPAPPTTRQIIDVNPKNDDTPLSSLIRVESPAPNGIVGSPLQITGQAVGGWFNEATFPVTLLDADRNVLTATYAKAEGDWMTGNFVPFSCEVKFTAAAGTPATLVLQLDNPSDDEGRQRSVEIPVLLE